jgi:NitT/TauT family transport system ATP-binding protein
MSRGNSAPVSIKVQNLGISYSTRTGSIPALLDISFQVAAGEFVALIGPSGCGKTTLLRAIGGLQTLNVGQIQVGDFSPNEARLARQISFVFQQTVLLPWYSVGQNVELPLRLLGCPQEECRMIARSFLEVVGLSMVADAYPNQLSGGMQQRVALARALAFEPAVLLMDEPFGSLDEITRETLNFELLRIWAAKKPTVLFVTHSLAEAIFLADRVLILSASPGTLVAEFRIPFPRPRTPMLLESTAFQQTVTTLRHHLRPGMANAAD